MLLMGKEGRAGLVVDCPGAMPFVRGIVGGVVYRDATIRRRIELCAAAPSSPRGRQRRRVPTAASRPRRRRATATMIKPMMESCLLVVRRSPWGRLGRLVARDRLDKYAAASGVRYISAR